MKPMMVHAVIKILTVAVVSLALFQVADAKVSRNSDTSRSSSSNTWIRGVNLGGWLVAERFITPYLFALTSCHLDGDFCFYPNQLSAPPREQTTDKNKNKKQQKHVYCDQFQCQPHLIEAADGRQDYPTDEWTLLSSFASKETAREYMTIHWDNFITKDDIKTLANVGVTHIRVPVPHYMFPTTTSDDEGGVDVNNDDEEEEPEPWLDGQWLYFLRLCNWAREYDIEVWLDLHTAPGSQNGFDNSGQLLSDAPTCRHWDDTSKNNINRTLIAIDNIASAVMDDSIRDVVTGFGILNEPWSDCDRTVLERFTNDAFERVRNIMGDDTHVFISDNFNSTTWDNGWWTEKEKYKNTYLDSHYYQVFGETERRMTPKQHIAYTCAKFQRGMDDCCYDKDDDVKKNTKVFPSQGISRIVGEWSAAFDILPVERLHDIMDGIKANFTAPFLLRELSTKRMEFMKSLVEAQMVTYENAKSGTSRGWFYWTIKMEGGAFAEWDFLRGVREGWIPDKFPSPYATSESMFGDCKSIASKTKDDDSVIEEFPDPTDMKRIGWGGPIIDDDYVLSHADFSSATASSAESGDSDSEEDTDDEDESNETDDDATKKETKKEKKKRPNWFGFFAMLLFGYGVWHVYLKDQYGFGRRRSEYQPLHSTTLTI